MSYKCNCGYKSYKYLGQCPSCRAWNTLTECEDVKKVHRIAKVSEKKKKEIELKKGDNSLEKWFEDRRKDMKGVCSCGCGAKSSRDDDKFYKFSICHILLKSKIKSVATHPLNFIELSFWNGHHGNFDNRSSLLWRNMACWDEILEKFLIMLPLIDDKERKYIPEVFSLYI